jgi:uncharacterized NAD-dependent epimerase/dehydratase family protein
MRKRSEMAVWGGVMAGLEACRSSHTPLATLGEFLGKLRRMGWQLEDTRTVEQCVLELMQWRITQNLMTTASTK